MVVIINSESQLIIPKSQIATIRKPWVSLHIAVRCARVNPFTDVAPKKPLRAMPPLL